MWYVELGGGGGKVRADCDGRLVWRHTPWLGAHAAKGPVVAKMASHAIFQYNILTIDDTHNT
jgi:hypothetical protein